MGIAYEGQTCLVSMQYALNERINVTFDVFTGKVNHDIVGRGESTMSQGIFAYDWNIALSLRSR